MQPLYDYGDEVRVIRNLRNDGSFPGKDKGDLLVRRGEVGHVRNIGTFLQDQIIYTVHFMAGDLQVGCREAELVPAGEPWVPSRFENRDRVKARKALSLRGEVIIQAGEEGEILKVYRDDPSGVYYHVLFPGHTLSVPETALQGSEEVEAAAYAQ